MIFGDGRPHETVRAASVAKNRKKLPETA